jgi:hypothetical protein
MIIFDRSFNFFHSCEELEFNDLIFKKLILLKANKVENFLELLKTYLINF